MEEVDSEITVLEEGSEDRAMGSGRACRLTVDSYLASQELKWSTWHRRKMAS